MKLVNKIHPNLWEQIKDKTPIEKEQIIKSLKSPSYSPSDCCNQEDCYSLYSDINQPCYGKVKYLKQQVDEHGNPSIHICEGHQGETYKEENEK